MDTLDTVAFARHLIDIDSTTGREQAVGDWLAAWDQLSANRPVATNPPDVDFNKYMILLVSSGIVGGGLCLKGVGCLASSNNGAQLNDQTTVTITTGR